MESLGDSTFAALSLTKAGVIADSQCKSGWRGAGEPTAVKGGIGAVAKLPQKVLTMTIILEGSLTVPRQVLTCTEGLRCRDPRA